MNLDKRQKAILVGIVIAVAILIWQIYALMYGDSTPAPSVSSTTPTAATVAPLKSEQHYPSAAITTTPAIDSSATNISNAQPLSAQQRQYLALVNAYQMAEVQRMIAADEAAIAQSRYQAAQALSKISSLSDGNSDASLFNFAMPSDTTSGSGNYELIYTGEENGQWTATVKKNGQFNDVTAGSVLPDGTKILSVDNNSVLIKQNNAEKLVTFNGVIPFVGATPATSEGKSAQRLQQQLPLTKTPVVTKTPVTTPVPAIVKKPPVVSLTTQKSEKTVEKTVEKTSVHPVVVAPPVVVHKPVSVVEKTAVTKNNIPLQHPNIAAAKIAVTPALSEKIPLNAHAYVAPAIKESALAETVTDFLQHNKNAYTVQLIGDRQSSAIRQFIIDNQLQGKAFAIKTVRSGKAWYIAIMGQYATVNEAQHAIYKLPKAARTERPFVKRIGDIHPSMEP